GGLHEMAHAAGAAGRADQAVRADLTVLDEMLGRGDDPVARRGGVRVEALPELHRPVSVHDVAGAVDGAGPGSALARSLLAARVRVVPGQVDPAARAGHDPRERVRSLG